MADPQPPARQSARYVREAHLPGLSDAIDAYGASRGDADKTTATQRTAAWLQAYCDWVENGGGGEAIPCLREDLKQLGDRLDVVNGLMGEAPDTDERFPQAVRRFRQVVRPLLDKAVGPRCKHCGRPAPKARGPWDTDYTCCMGCGKLVMPLPPDDPPLTQKEQQERLVPLVATAARADSEAVGAINAAVALAKAAPNDGDPQTAAAIKTALSLARKAADAYKQIYDTAFKVGYSCVLDHAAVSEGHFETFIDLAEDGDLGSLVEQLEDDHATVIDDEYRHLMMCELRLA